MNSSPRISGRQLTTMVVAICTAAVLAPVGVYAAAHSTVSIVDGKHASRVATVSKSGAQLISGAVSLTGTPSVRTQPGLQGTPYLKLLNGSSTSFTVPAGKTLQITSIGGDALVGGGAKPYVALELNGGGLSAAQLVLPLTYDKTTPGGDDLYVCSDNVNLPLPAGTSVLQVSSPSTNDENDPEIVIAGYLVKS